MAEPIKSRYIPALDGLRAIAVAGVIFYHMGFVWAPCGLLGVTMFFVLSGYLITSLLLVEFRNTGGISLGRFWFRRIRRLFPALLAVVIACLALFSLLDHVGLTKMRPDIIPTLLSVNNWWQIFNDISYFEALGTPSPLTHCWSLSIEEQFYVVWPVLLLVLLKLGARKSHLTTIAVVLIAASAAGMALLYDPAADPSRVYYGTDTRAFSLLIGALLAMVWPAHQFTPEGGSLSKHVTLALDVIGIAALIGCVIMMAVVGSSSPFVYRGGVLLCSVLTALTIAASVDPATTISKVLGWKPLVWIGKLSYSMYLWHYPLLLLMNPARLAGTIPWWGYILQALVIVGAAALSYYFIENPIRRGGIGEAVKKLRSKETRRRAVGPKGAVTTLVVIAVTAWGITGCIRTPDAQTDVVIDTHTPPVTEAIATIQADYEERLRIEAEEAAREARRYQALLIGDSVCVAISDLFAEQVERGHVDAKVSRQFIEGPGIYSYYANEDLVSHVVIIALGTNGPMTQEQVDSFLDQIGSDKQVYLVTTRSNRSWESEVNSTLASTAEARENVEIIDWHAYSEGHGDWFYSDGIHLVPEGAQAYVDMLKQAIGM